MKVNYIALTDGLRPFWVNGKFVLVPPWGLTLKVVMPVTLNMLQAS